MNINWNTEIEDFFSIPTTDPQSFKNKECLHLLKIVIFYDNSPLHPIYLISLILFDLYIDTARLSYVHFGLAACYFLELVAYLLFSGYIKNDLTED